MFTYTIKLRKSAVVTTLLAVVVVAVTLLLLPVRDTAVATFKQSKAPRCSSNADRVQWLRDMGWEVEETPCSELSVVIPETFDELYSQYAMQQRQIGFRLEKHRGRTAEKYCYLVLNYGDKGEPAVASILQRGDRVIAADLSSARLGGFLKPLQPRNETKMK